MKVKAMRQGFYDNRRIEVGEVFNLSDKKHFSKLWMEDTKKKRTGKAAPLTEETQEVEEERTSEQEVI